MMTEIKYAFFDVPIQIATRIYMFKRNKIVNLIRMHMEVYAIFKFGDVNVCIS